MGSFQWISRSLIPRASAFLASVPSLSGSFPRLVHITPTANLWQKDDVKKAVAMTHKLPGKREDAKSKEDSEDNGAALSVYDMAFRRAGSGPRGRTKSTFSQVVDSFCEQDIRRHGHVEFIYAALRCIPMFGLKRDLSVYHSLLKVFPKEVFVPVNFIQRMFNHYARQQECALAVLEQMEHNGVWPTRETKDILVQVFGNKCHPIKKLHRILYWFPKFRHANPFPVPDPLPTDPLAVSSLALNRIANDLDARVTIYQSGSDAIDVNEDKQVVPHIVGIQSPDQREELSRHDVNKPLYVDGPERVWLRDTPIAYYILRGDVIPADRKNEHVDPERSLYYPLELDLDLERDLGDDLSFHVEDVPEGPVFAMCVAGDADQATLARWITGLQEDNPVLTQMPIIFRMTEHDFLESEQSDGEMGQEQQLASDQEPEHDSKQRGSTYSGEARAKTCSESGEYQLDSQDGYAEFDKFSGREWRRERAKVWPNHTSPFMVTRVVPPEDPICPTLLARVACSTSSNRDCSSSTSSPSLFDVQHQVEELKIAL
uniref:Evolutionarily conserved signaling intermediate in Toll pathway, mitochondrial n=1 Tax=Eptatretus burgeri TaxID=7764 RepID=A0A8C4PWI7_EPTBU